MLLTPKLLNEVWNRVRQEPIGLWLRVEEPDKVVHELHATRPPGMSNYTIARTPELNILFITVPGTTLDDIPVEPAP